MKFVEYRANPIVKDEKSIMSHFIILLMTFLVFWGSHHGAHAADITDRDAQRLKLLFIDEMSKQREAIEQRGGFISLLGAVEVEKADTYYAVTLPEMNVVDTVSGNLTQIGLIAINAVPTDNPTQWKMSMTLPSRIETQNKEGNIISTVTIGTQRFGGLWDETLGGFEKLAVRYQDVGIVTQDGRQLNIEQIMMAMNSAQKENDLIDHQNKIDVSGISLNNATAYEKDLMPSYINVDLAGANVPFTPLKEIVQKLTNNHNGRGAQQLAALQAFMNLPTLLSEAEATFTINEFKFGNDVYTATLDSDMKGTETSILGLMGTMNAEFTNLDKLIRRLKVHQDSVENKDNIQGIITTLETVRSFAKTSEEKDRFQIELGDNSRITVNEKDASTILLGGN